MPTQRNKATQSNIDLTMVNTATQQPVVYTGETAMLGVVLTNNTGSDIGLLAGSQPSVLEIFLPTFYQLSDLHNMQISLSGWAFSVNSIDETLLLTCTAAGTWPNGAQISFQITNTNSAATPPQGDIPQINPTGLSGSNIPSQVLANAPLSLQTPANNNNADLTQILELTLNNNGVIYVSENSNELIANDLVFNLKNTGSQPLYTGTGPWESTPKVLVYFVYGATPGSLASDNDKKAPQPGSAWNIQGNIESSEGNNWSIQQPANQHPQWLLLPNSANPGILGTGDNANITFQFTDIVSLTPTGHTQMYVQFAGFPGYNDHLFALDIDKQDLPSPGLINFSSLVNEITINSDSEIVCIPLQWMMTGVEKVIISVYPNYLLDDIITYSGMQPILQQDTLTLELKGVTQTTTLLITCTAYNAEGQQLGDLQQSVPINFPPNVSTYEAELLENGSLLLNWTTQGATKVSIPRVTATTLNPDGPYSVPAPVFPLLNNNYYALTASNGVVSTPPYIFKRVVNFTLNLLTNIVTGSWGMAVSPNGNYAFLTNSDGSISVIEVNGTPPFNVVNIQANLGEWPVGIAVSPDGNYVFAGSLLSSEVSVIGINTNPPFQMLAPLTVGAASSGIAFSPDDKYVFIADFGGNAVSVLEMNSTPAFNLLTSITVGGKPLGIVVSPDSNYVFVSNYEDNSVTIIDINSSPPFNVLQTIQVGKQPVGIAISPDGNFVFVSNSGDANVSVIAVNSSPPFSVLPPIAVGNAPTGIAVSPDNSYVFVSNFSDNTVSVIEIMDKPPFQVLQTIDSTVFPTGLAISPDSHYVFVASLESQNISVIVPSAVTADRPMTL